jgi:hypothetical protein
MPEFRKIFKQLITLRSKKNYTFMENETRVMIHIGYPVVISSRDGCAEHSKFGMEKPEK